MKNIILIFFALILSVQFANAQTTIDIVRASNYYSKAVSNYRSSSYNSALQNLKDAETNLKGKTNKDLEYLKIMIYYKLKNFKNAYNLVTIYFEKGYKDRIQYFKNIKTYRETSNINYNEALTGIFVELEDKYGVVKNLSIDKVIEVIVKRIKEKKKDRKEIMMHNSKEYVTLRTMTYTPIQTYKNYRTGTVTKSYGGRSNSYRFARNIHTNEIKYTNSSRSWSKTFFFHHKTFTNSSYYSYSYIIKHINDNIRYNISLDYHTNWYNHSRGRSSYEEMKRKIVSGLRSDYHNDDFIKKTSYGKFKIYFTDNEKLILQQSGNLNKLKVALTNNNLL